MTTSTDWNALLQEHVTPLYRHVSRRVGGDRELAEDVTQETWLRAIDRWRRQGPPRDPGAWLRTVAMNLVRSHFRRRPLESLGDTSEGLADSPGGAPDEHRIAPPDGLSPGPAELERAARLQWGLARLRANQAGLLAAHHLDGHSIAALAKAHGLSERAVEGRLHRARGALRALLGTDFLTTDC